MKRKTAKEILAESFIELAQNHPVDTIKIKDITDNCGYSPATFYRQFNDKYDLILWSYAKDYEELINSINQNSENPVEVRLGLVSDYYYANREYLKRILKSERGYAKFVKPVELYHFNRFMKILSEHYGIKDPNKKTEMVVWTYVTGAIGTAFDWIEGLWNVSADEAKQVFLRSFPAELKEKLK